MVTYDYLGLSVSIGVAYRLVVVATERNQVCGEDKCRMADFGDEEPPTHPHLLVLSAGGMAVKKTESHVCAIFCFFIIHRNDEFLCNSPFDNRVRLLESKDLNTLATTGGLRAGSVGGGHVLSQADNRTSLLDTEIAAW